MTCPDCKTHHQERTTDGRCLACVRAQAARLGKDGPA